LDITGLTKATTPCSAFRAVEVLNELADFILKHHRTMVEGILEVKFPTIWTDEKQSRAEAEGRERLEREDQRRERVRRKKMQMREKVGKSRNTMFFQ